VRFQPLGIHGGHITEAETSGDERGSFFRTYDGDAFEAAGLERLDAQHSISTNHARGTWRGLHYQVPPHDEAKLVRCVRGAILDVIVDIRAESPTFRTLVTIELSEDNRRAVFLPRGVAHGFLTLTDRADLHYQISTAYEPGSRRGVRYDDPSLALDLPLPVTVVSDRDRAFPDLGWIDQGSVATTLRR